MSSKLADPPKKIDAPTKDLQLDSASYHSASTTLSDLLDIDVDPSVLFANITALLTALEDTVSSLGTLRLQSSVPVTEQLSSACHDLFKKLCELEAVVGTYVAVGGTGLHGEQISLDPMLYKWAADCMLCLLGLQAELQEELGQKPKSVSGVSIAETTGTLVDEDDGRSLAETLVNINGTDDTLRRYLTEIKSFSARVQEALPVIQADFGTYQTSHLDFPSGQPSEQKLGSTDPVPPNATIKVLRKALYTLKDTLSALNSSIDHVFTDCAAADAPVASATGRSLRAAQARVNHAAAALTTYLTNDGSDWLDSLLAGNLSFSRFRCTDVAFVRRIDSDLAEWMDHARIVSIEARYNRNSTGDIAAMDFRLPEGQFEKLAGLLDELGRVLRIRPLEAREEDACD